MRKYLKTIIIVIFMMVILITAVVVLALSTKVVNNTMYGMKFEIGDHDPSSFEVVKIQVRGTYSRNFLYGHKFQGNIIFNDDEMMKHTEVNILYGKTNGGSFVYFNDGKNYLATPIVIGSLFSDNRFKSMAIAVFNEQEEGLSNWTKGEQYIIVAPATSKEEALVIANKLMKDSAYDPEK